MSTTSADHNWNGLVDLSDININCAKKSLQNLNTLLRDLDRKTVVALDHIKDATGDLDEDSHTFEALDEVGALCDDIQKLIEHAMDKAEQATRIIENA